MTAKDLTFTFQQLIKKVFYWRLYTDIDDSLCIL
jgi:hypothetical protein